MELTEREKKEERKKKPIHNNWKGGDTGKSPCVSYSVS